jgi:hypothetical protein
MGSAPGTFNASTPQGALCNVFHCISGLELSKGFKWSHRAQKDILALDSRTTHSQIVQQGITNILWKW